MGQEIAEEMKKDEFFSKTVQIIYSIARWYAIHLPLEKII